MADTITATQIKRESKYDQIARPMNVKTIDDNELIIDWQKEVNIGAQYENHRQKGLNTLAELQEMLGGYLGHTDMPKPRIKLTTLNVRAINSSSDRAGPKAGKVKNMKFDKTLCMIVEEPAESEKASPIVFAPKKDGQLWLRIDYRKLNTMHIKKMSSISRVDACLDVLGKERIFST